MTFCDLNFMHWDHSPTHKPPKCSLLLIDRTCQCCVAGPSSYWNFPWPIISYSHGCLPPPPTPNVTKRENKSNNSVSHYSVSIWFQSAVCVRERERDTMWMFYFPYILSSHTKLFVHALSPSFGLLLPLTPSRISQLCLHAHNFDTQV